jgi:hypothetical protein
MHVGQFDVHCVTTLLVSTWDHKHSLSGYFICTINLQSCYFMVAAEFGLRSKTQQTHSHKLDSVGKRDFFHSCVLERSSGRV